MKNVSRTVAPLHLLSNELPEEILSATNFSLCDVLAAEPQASDGLPKWVKISPRGTFTTRDDRTFTVDPEALVARFNAEGVKIPMDIDHATAKKAFFGDEAPAVGWIEELSARPDGLYGRVEWLEEGERVLKAKTHRYLSPTWPQKKDGSVSYLHSVALVAAPALSMPAVASAAITNPETPMLKAIAKALGLNEDATEQSCLAAISQMSIRIDPAVHQAALSSLSATRAELEEVKKAGREKEVNELLEDALKAKKIAPAQRDHFAALCATDDGLKSVKELLATLAAGLQPSGLDDRTAAPNLSSLSAEDRKMMSDLGLTEDEYRKANGLTAA